MSNPNNPTSLSELLRNLRMRKKISLTLAAAHLRIDIGLLSKMERGERNISRKLLPKFAALYKASERKLVIQFLSEKIVSDLSHEKFGRAALKKATDEFKYIPPKKNLSKKR